MAKQSSPWDAVVIGSGIGGLVSAVLMAKMSRKRVLVLERHTKPGGFTHTFKRKVNFEFDTGVHYIGELSRGSRLRSLLDFLTNGRLQWRELPYEYDRMLFDTFDWNVPSSRREHLNRLVERFPKEAQSLLRYFKIEQQTADAYGLWQFSEKYAWPLRKLVRFYLRVFRPEMFWITTEALKKYFKNPDLIHILGSRWMGFGIPPEQSCFGMHCVHGIHYGEGAWYPEEGGQSIADHLVESLRQCGGEIRLKTTAQEVVVKDGHVVGVRAVDGQGREEFFAAPQVVSNAGAKRTFLDLLPSEIPISFREQLEASECGTSVLSLFMGLKTSPRTLGLEAANYWFCPEGQEKILEAEGFSGAPFWCFLSFPSLKQGSAHHTAQAIVMTNPDSFQKWSGTRWRRRPEDYEEFKQKLTDLLLSEIERRFPGLGPLIDFAELSTPLSVEHFHGAPKGSVYGVPTVPERFRMPWTESATPVKGLFLTGSDVFCPGISGAIHGALKTYDVMKSRGAF